MVDNPQQWPDEFKEMGPAKVRTALATGRWSGQKQAAARLWVENIDAQSWQKSRKDQGADRQSLSMRLRSTKWAKYIIPAAMVLFGLGMMLRRLRF